MLNLFGYFLVAVLAFGGGYWKGGDARENKIRAQLADQQKVIDDQAQTARSEQRTEENKAVETFVKTAGAATKTEQKIAKEIPAYVPQKANNACIVPLGFISVYDQATIAANGEADQDSAPGSDQSRPPHASDTVQVPEWAKQNSGMSLSDIAEVHNRNMRAFTQLRGMYTAMRHWANTSCYAP